MTSYSMYFNRKYKRLGPVFQQRYRAIRIVNDEQLMHIGRYVHLNPDKYIKSTTGLATAVTWAIKVQMGCGYSQSEFKSFLMETTKSP